MTNQAEVLAQNSQKENFIYLGYQHVLKGLSQMCVGMANMYNRTYLTISLNFTNKSDLF